jgi:hypothetical protein
MVSAAEVRAARTGESRVVVRPCDTGNITAAMRGKVELMLTEDSPDGASTEDRLIEALLGEAEKHVLDRWLDVADVEPIAEEFGGGMRLAIDDSTSADDAVASFEHVSGLLPAARTLAKDLDLDPNDPAAIACAGELVLEFLYVHNRLSKVRRRGGAAYGR